MKRLLALMFLTPSVAFAQPADRDFTLTIPGAQVVRVQAVCERIRQGMDEPIPATITIRRCMRRILFQELRQLNGSLARRKAIADEAADINAFDAGMADE